MGPIGSVLGTAVAKMVRGAAHQFRLSHLCGWFCGTRILSWLSWLSWWCFPDQFLATNPSADPCFHPVSRWPDSHPANFHAGCCCATSPAAPDESDWVVSWPQQQGAFSTTEKCVANLANISESLGRHPVGCGIIWLVGFGHQNVTGCPEPTRQCHRAK